MPLVNESSCRKILKHMTALETVIERMIHEEKDEEKRKGRDFAFMTWVCDVVT